MSDPAVMNEILKQVVEAYRVFSIELKSIQMKKTDLIKAILHRVDQEKTIDIENTIKQIIHERTNQHWSHPRPVWGWR